MMGKRKVQQDALFENELLQLGKTVAHCACAILRSGNTGRYGRIARGGAKTSGLYRRSLSAFSTPASRKGRHRRSVPRTNSLIRHQRRNILQEALHRLQELIKVAVAVAVEVDLEGIATRCEKGAACYPRPLARSSGRRGHGPQ